MIRNRQPGYSFGAALAVLANIAYSAPPGAESPLPMAPAKMPRIGTVDERFQSFNIEMVEVIGGRFWKPYGKEVDAALKKQHSAEHAGSTPVGMDPSIYEQRAPLDLSNPRLRKLAAALAPAYMRVSGTWANTVYFQDGDAPALTAPPAGFGGILTRQEWKGVVDFSHTVDAKIVTSFATCPGTRDSVGIWIPEQARRFLTYTKSIGGSIAAAEFMNEPTYAAMGGAPKGYDATAYGRDIAVFRPFIKQEAPEIVFLGPGSVGEGGSLPISLGGGMLRSEDLLKDTGDVFDVFSYHFYGGASKRCASLGAASQTTADEALSEEWLSRTEVVEEFYAGLRDKFAPGKPLWITETADAACGGNPWASTFLDSFRYLDQLGRLAKLGVQVITHNTLASSDYGLLDENTYTPRPNYWAAFLWRKLMGTTVLNPGPSPSPSLHLYAHCLRGKLGGVAFLVINTDKTVAQSLALGSAADRYTLTARKLLDRQVQLNGRELKLDAGDALPRLSGLPTQSGTLTFGPASITFLAMPDANNDNCR
jgi:heparanase